MTDPVRLTSLAHGGGCGCKLAPAVLRDILARMPVAGPCADMLVGIETGDDAAVYRLNDRQASSPPPTSSPRSSTIRATSAASPPPTPCPTSTPWAARRSSPWPSSACRSTSSRSRPSQAILAGGAAACAEAGIPVAGGHSIDSPEPIYGLVAVGLVHPGRVLRNVGARAGDRLVLTKGLGVGIQGAALKRGLLPPEGYAAMIASTTQLNRLGADMPAIPGVHAMTDVTGFGLLGHALEMVRGRRPRPPLDFAALPLLPGVADLAAPASGPAPRGATGPATAPR